MTGPAGAPPRTHRLRHNAREWTPPQFISLDVETRWADTAEGELHRPRLWAARLDVRRARYSGGIGTVRSRGHTPAELAEQISHWCKAQTTMWAYAHNLSFDLAATKLPVELQKLGWQVTGHAVATDTPWIRLKRYKCVLTIADSWGWLRAKLEDIGGDVGIYKPDLPAWDDSDEAWFARCEADVEILAAAMGQLMDWWDREQLGSWALTGSAAGWNTWRHHPGTELPLIVHGEGQVEADRAGIYGGRREVFWAGQLTGGPFTILDFRRAYTVIARDMPLPVARQGDFGHLATGSALVDSDRYGIIAQVEVETDVPRWPVRVAGRVAYPTGRFTTTLASPEIAEARRLGCLVSIGPGYLHKLGRPMAAWADWCLQLQADTSGRVPAVAKRALKHWGRAVVGKTAQHGWEQIRLESLGGSGWKYEQAWNHERQSPSHLAEVCGHASETVQTPAGDNTYPAILAFVESWCRVFLARAIEAIGLEHVAACDTDGLIAAGPVDWPAALAAADLGPLVMREKARYAWLRVIGPQHMWWPGGRKLAGIPPGARPNERGKLEALVWPKLASQMRLRPGDSEAAYLRARQEYTLTASYVTGWVMPGGRVWPLEAAVCPAGRTHLLPWDERDGPAPEPQAQASHLRSMIEPLPAGGQECAHHSCKPNGKGGGSSPSHQITRSESTRSGGTRKGAKVTSWLASGRSFVRRVFRG